MDKNTAPDKNEFCGGEYYNNGYTKNPAYFPEYFEKRNIKAVSNRIGLGIILYNIIIILFQSILYYIFYAFGKQDLLNDGFFIMELNIVLTAMAFLPAGALIMKANGSGGEVSFSKPEFKNFIPLVLFATGFMFAGNVVIIMLQNNLSFLGELKTVDTEIPDGIGGFLISVLSVAVFPAFLEEFFFRGAVMGSLLRFGKPFAIFTSAVIFSLVHGNLVQIPFAFLAGLVIGYAVLETKSIWTGILIHFINNFSSLVLMYILKPLTEEAEMYIYFFYFLIMLFVGFFGFYFYCKKNPNALEFEKQNFKVSSVGHFKWFMGSVTMVIFMIFTVLEIISIQVAA